MPDAKPLSAVVIAINWRPDLTKFARCPANLGVTDKICQQSCCETRALSALRRKIGLARHLLRYLRGKQLTQ